LIDLGGGEKLLVEAWSSHKATDNQHDHEQVRGDGIADKPTEGTAHSHCTPDN